MTEWHTEEEVIDALMAVESADVPELRDYVRVLGWFREQLQKDMKDNAAYYV